VPIGSLPQFSGLAEDVLKEMRHLQSLSLVNNRSIYEAYRMAREARH
jgi:hypothetical protein